MGFLASYYLRRQWNNLCFSANCQPSNILLGLKVKIAACLKETMPFLYSVFLILILDFKTLKYLRAP